MVSIEFLKTTPNKMDAIDMKAIARLRNYLETEIYMNNLDISESSLLNENNYAVSVHSSPFSFFTSINRNIRIQSKNLTSQPP